MNKIKLNKTKLKVALVASMAGLFVPAQTYAIDLIASSEIPSIGFVDINILAETSFDTWSLSGDSEFFLLQDVNANATSENTHTVMSIFGANSANLNENSFVVDSAGDVNLANGSVFVDRSTGSVGIGTSTPADDLSIVGSDPTIRLEDTDGTNWEINSKPEGTTFDISNDSTAVSMLKIESDAREDALVLNATGIGMGTDAPTYALHVRNQNKRMLNLENINGLSTIRRLLRMSNAGPVGFEMTDRDNPVTWQFRSGSNGDFLINQQATVNAELTVGRDTGNLTVKGSVIANGVMLTSSRASKTDISAIKVSEVMAKLKKVEVAEWRYKAAGKNDRHISPMAEDFYSLFKLGPDNKHINPNDLASVAIIAAKELQKQSDIASNATASLKAETVALKTETDALKAENISLKYRLASLEKLVTNLASGQGLLPENGDTVVFNKVK